MQAREVVISSGMSVNEIQTQINNSQVDDVIRFSKGTYKLSKSLELPHSVLLEGIPGDSSGVVLQVSDNFRHIKAVAGKIIIKSITFEGLGEQLGGGIEYLGSDSLILSGCELSRNKNQNGGAVYSSGNVFLMNCLLSNNTATVNGGALYNKGKTWLASCFFSENKAGNMGGAVYNQARTRTRIEPVNIVGSVFAKNTASQGGAISCENSAEIESCIFAENQATYSDGGAVFTENTASLFESTFYRNTSKANGGGLSAQRLVKISNCTFSENQAEGTGGAVHNMLQGDSSVDEISIIRFSVFSKNTSKSGGGIYSGLATIVLDSHFELNRSKGSGGGIFCGKSLLLNRTCFNENTALSEGGAVDAETSRVFNTTMVNNKAQNAGAVHTFENSAIVFSTFVGNETDLNSGSVIYGKNIILYGNIIAGNKRQDKVAGKIKSGESNIIGASVPDIFQTTNAGLTKKPGSLPVMAIKSSGPAAGKIPPGKLVNWEKELGITDFLNLDQLQNNRSFERATDIGAVLLSSGNSASDKQQMPIVDIPGVMTSIRSRKISDMQIIHLNSTNANALAGIDSQSKTLPTQSAGLKKTALSSLDEELDRIIELILLEETFGTEDLADVTPAIEPKQQPPATSVDAPNLNLKPLVINPDSKPVINNKTKSDNDKPKDKSEESPHHAISRPKYLQSETSKSEQPQSTTSKSENSVLSGSALSGIYTINPKKTTGERNFASIEEAVNKLNSVGTSNAIRFIIAPGIYVTDKSITISNAQHPTLISGDENSKEKPIIRSKGNNRSIVIAVASPVSFTGLIFEGPSGEQDGKTNQNGGGISCNTESQLTFIDCIFRYNKNQTGAGILARNVVISRCAFYNNTASDGAGIYGTECIVVNSTFYGNKTGVGGGIYAKEKATVVFCTFTQNESTGKGAAIFASNIYLYGSIVAGNKAGKDKDVDGTLRANFSNIMGGLLFNIFSEADTKGFVELNLNTGTSPVVTVKSGGMASEQISESLFRQWEDELGLDILSVDQHGKRRPQNRNAEIGAWEIPDRRGE